MLRVGKKPLMLAVIVASLTLTSAIRIRGVVDPSGPRACRHCRAHAILGGEVLVGENGHALRFVSEEDAADYARRY